MSVRRVLYEAGVAGYLLPNVLDYERRILDCLDWHIHTITLVSAVVGLCSCVGVSGRSQLCCAMFSDYLLLDPQIQSFPLSEVVVAVVRCVCRSLQEDEVVEVNDDHSLASSSPRSSSSTSSTTSTPSLTDADSHPLAMLEGTNCSLLCRICVEKAWGEVKTTICSSTEHILGNSVGVNWINWPTTRNYLRDEIPSTNGDEDVLSPSSNPSSSPSSRCLFGSDHQVLGVVVQTYEPTFLTTIQSRL